MNNPRDRLDEPFGIDPVVARVVFLGMVALVLGGVVAFITWRQPLLPPSAVVAADPLLRTGQTLFLDRCISCHGASGRGDGVLAKSLTGPAVGDLTITKWKHGDRPEEIQAVIAQGVANSQMPGWKSVFNPSEVKAVTAFVYHLAGRDVPQVLRSE